MFSRRSPRFLAVAPTVLALAMLGGCQTSNQQTASRAPAAVCSPQTANVRVDFWKMEVEKLNEQLENLAHQSDRYRSDHPGLVEPVTLQVGREQTVALLLRARTELQDAKLAQMVAEVEARQAEMQKVSSATR